MGMAKVEKVESDGNGIETGIGLAVQSSFGGSATTKESLIFNVRALPRSNKPSTGNSDQIRIRLRLPRCAKAFLRKINRSAFP